MDTARRHHPPTTRLVALGAGAAVALSLGGAGVAAALGGAAPGTSAVPAGLTLAEAATRLTDTEVVAMREEERLAGDVYRALADITGQTMFARIAASEDRHRAAVERLLAGRGVDVGSLQDTPGEYAVAGYSDLYDELLDHGAESPAAAYEVGTRIERTDIADLRALLDRTLTDAERRVVTALLAGSQHHLAAFTRAAEGDGPGNGPGTRMGNGPGTGMGNGMGHSQRPGPRHGLGAPSRGADDCPLAPTS